METSSEPRRIMGLGYIGLAIVAILLCGGCVIVGGVGAFLAVKASVPPTPTLPPPPTATEMVGRDYRQILENNGLTYSSDDDDGDPIYVSSCGLVATVKQDYVGYAAKYDPNDSDSCAVEDLGATISTIYPPEVFDYILNNMEQAMGSEEIVEGTAAGHSISLFFDQADYIVLVIIRDPH